MDKKKKNGPNGSEDQDHKFENDSKSRPAQTSPTNGDTTRASTGTSSDKESNKAHAHAPDDANKQGPQKKRRKVTHGTALPHPDRTVAVLHGIPQSPRLRALTLCPRFPTACVYCRRSVSRKPSPSRSANWLLSALWPQTIAVVEELQQQCCVQPGLLVLAHAADSPISPYSRQVILG